MKIVAERHPDAPDRGQVLPLFALFLVVLLGFAALAIDVSNRYASQRFYRAVADAAALAGAQDLQRTATDGDRTRARTHALQIVWDRLGATGDRSAVSVTSADMLNWPLPGTDYLVSIKATAAGIACVSCLPSRSVQVTVRNPEFSLSFARVFGQTTWDVSSTSVAGLQFSAKYALITLRPPDILPNSTDKNRDNIDLAGTNVRLNILRGDVGTNTYVRTNSASLLTLAEGYTIDHIDNIVPDGWNKVDGLPVGQLITELIPDPGYRPPARPTDSSKIYANEAAGSDGTVSATETCGAPAGALPVGTKCYKSGIYTSAFTVGGSGPGAYFKPGAYFFDKGLSVGSGASLWGGLQSNEPGVVIVVPQTMTGGNKGFDGTSATSIILNRGSATCTADTCRASPAKDFQGTEIKTPEGLVLTIMVPREESCFAGTTPQLCSDNQNTAVKLAGNGKLIVAGVVYAPSDKSQINANQTDQDGVIGQIIAWTVKYAGGATLNQSYPGGEEVGFVRLDAACTAPSTPCIRP